MPFDLSNAVVYDIEVLPNCFTLTMEMLHQDVIATWEISDFRDDRVALMTWFNWLNQTQTPMIGFNNLGYDYIIIHYIFNNPNCTPADIYAKNQQIFASQSGNRFELMIWDRDRFAPQIDLFKIHHFDNRAKTTGLKALEINMRSENVMDSPIQFGVPVTEQQVQEHLIPYNIHDVKETKRFAHYSMKAIEFRIGLIPQFGLEVLNYNDTKIGAKTLEQRIGEDILYDRSSGRKVIRQTIRHKIALNDIIFPYIRFSNPEFQRVLDYMRAQVLTPDDIDDPDAPIKTKGVFSGLSAHVGSLDFHFGTGGIHGSVSAQRVISSEDWLIRDIDVEGLYPNIAIVNRLAPEHLGDVFITEYAKIPAERKKHAKGTVENASFKLAANGTYGNSNNKFSPFLDAQFTMTITINGQLMLCMLAEWLIAVPTLQIIQINTDGITYRIHRDHEPTAAAICKQWEAYTCLKLEDANYRRMFIRDVNNYIAESLDGKLKIKGAYWTPDPLNYAASISEASPPCWHKDLGGVVIQRAAVAAMVHDVPPEDYIRACSNPYDFMLRVKADRSSQLWLGGQQGRQVQNNTRYYVSTSGESLIKISPPSGPLGQYKRRNGVTDVEFNRIAATLAPDQHDERIHTKNRSRYEQRETNIEAGWKVTECNNAARFNFANVNYDYYIAEARKLII